MRCLTLPRYSAYQRCCTSIVALVFLGGCFLGSGCGGTADELEDILDAIGFGSFQGSATLANVTGDYWSLSIGAQTNPPCPIAPSAGSFPYDSIGRVTADGAGNILSTTDDNEGCAPIILPSQVSNETYTTSANGSGQAGGEPYQIQDISGNLFISAFLSDPLDQGVGVATRAPAGGMSLATLSGVYGFAVLGMDAGTGETETLIIHVTFDGGGAVQAAIYRGRNNLGPPTSGTLAGTYTLQANGTGTINIPGLIANGKMRVADGAGIVLITEQSTAGVTGFAIGVPSTVPANFPKLTGTYSFVGLSLTGGSIAARTARLGEISLPGDFRFAARWTERSSGGAQIQETDDGLFNNTGIDTGLGGPGLASLCSGAGIASCPPVAGAYTYFHGPFRNDGEVLVLIDQSPGTDQGIVVAVRY